MLEVFNEAFNNLKSKLGGWINDFVVNLPNIVLAAIVMSLGIFAAQYVRKYVQKGLNKFVNNKTITGFASSMITAGFLVAMLLVVLSILKLDTALTSILGTAGIAGLAVGLALQEPIVNVFAGIVMSMREHYSVGDLVKTNDFFGTISKINLRSTILNTPDGQEVIIPNKEVLQNPIVNYTHSDKRRVDIDCGVAYGDDLETAREIALEAIRGNEKVKYDRNMPLELFFTEFGDSSINFQLRFWYHFSSHADFMDLKSEAIIAIKKAFDSNNITIPFPVTTLDFGVVGGRNIDDVYPLKSIATNPKSNGKHNGKAVKNGTPSITSN
jgi:small conductance mechanosensitive channel